MDFPRDPLEIDEEYNSLRPLEFDDDEFEEDDDIYVFEDDSYAYDDDDDEYEDSGFGGWDDLKPFTSYDDESAWGDMLG